MKILLGFVFAFFLMAAQRPINTRQNLDNFKILSNTPLLKTRWKLIELSSNILPSNSTQKEMYMILKSDSTVKGDGGCNTFSGSYAVGKNNEISFGEMVRTNVFCEGIDFERKFLNALSKADYYEIKGDTLSLKSQLVNLAKFVADKKQ